MIELDGTDEQGPARRQCDPRRQPGDGARRRRDAVGLPLYRYVGGVDANLLPVPMMNILNGGVHADNAHRLPGIHGHAGRRADFRRGAALRSRDFPRAEGALHQAGLVDRRRRRGRLRAEHRFGRAKRSTSSRRRSSAAGYKLGDDVLLAMDPAASEFFKDGALRTGGRGQEPDPRSRWPIIYVELARDYPIASIEDGMAEDDWPGGRR